MSSGRQERSALVASLMDADHLPSLGDEAWRRVPPLALVHGLSTRLDSMLENTTAPPDVRRAMRDQAMAALAVQLQVEADLQLAQTVLRSTAVPWVAVKGPVLSEHWYARSGQRTYVDLDLVVEPAGFADVLDALLASGAVLVDRNFTHALHQKRAELNLFLPYGTALDLHWHVLNTPGLRRDFPLSMSEWLGRRRPAQVGPLKVPTLDPEDTLLHLCLHTVLSGASKLSWYRDVHQVVATGRLDWPVFVERAAAAQAELVAALVLERTQRLCGSPVPAEVKRLRRGGQGWRAGLRLLEIVSPAGTALDRRLSGQLAWQSTRADTLSSLHALHRTVADDFFTPLWRDPEHPWRRLRRRESGRKDNPLRRPADDDQDKQRYLDYVKSQANSA